MYLNLNGKLNYLCYQLCDICFICYWYLCHLLLCCEDTCIVTLCIRYMASSTNCYLSCRVFSQINFIFKFFLDVYFIVLLNIINYLVLEVCMICEALLSCSVCVIVTYHSLNVAEAGWNNNTRWQCWASPYVEQVLRDSPTDYDGDLGTVTVVIKADTHRD